jgi:Flp pilus assembly protein TadD
VPATDEALVPVENPVDLAISWWALGILLEAFRGCAGTSSLVTFALVLLTAGAGSAFAFRGRSWTAFGMGSLVFLGVAWLLHDRLYLLGDSRLWVHHAQVFGTEVPPYRAPLGATLMGLVGSVGSNPTLMLSLLSVVCGSLTAAALAWGTWRRTENGQESPGAWLLLALCFGQPLSLIFYGHIETYALLAVALGLFLASVGLDVRDSRVSPRSVLLLLILVLTHLVGVLILIPLLTVFGFRRPRGGITVYPVLLVILAGAVLVVPALRGHSIVGQGWSAKEILVYLGDVLNGWFLLLLPAGVLFFVLGKPRINDPYGRFLGYATLTFALLPLLRIFELGIYRDLDLFAPAFVTVTFLMIHLLVRGPAPSRSRLLAVLGTGAILLAPWITLSISDAGNETMAKQLRRGAMTTAGRSYGYETLAFSAWDADDLESAESMMRSAIAVTPGNRRQYGPLGEIQLARGDTTSAIASLEESMSTPRAPRTAPLLGELYTRTGRFRDAIEVLEPHREEMVRKSCSASTLAVAYYWLDLPESTVAVGRQRLTVEPGDDVAHFNVASGLTKMGDYKKAIQSLRNAASIDPTRIDYHLALVRVMLQLPDGEAEAENYLRGLESGLRNVVLREL